MEQTNLYSVQKSANHSNVNATIKELEICFHESGKPPGLCVSD